MTSYTLEAINNGLTTVNVAGDEGDPRSPQITVATRLDIRSYDQIFTP